MEMDFKRIERRTRQAGYDDGIAEMGLGVLGLLGGGCFFSYSFFPPGFPGPLFWGIGVFAATIVGARLIGRAIRSLKQKWSYPRAGYASYRPPGGTGKRRLISLSGAVAGFVSALAYGFLKDSFGFASPPFFFGLLFSLSYIYTGIRLRLARFYLYSFVAVVAGTILGQTGWTWRISMGALFAILGAVLLVSGVVVFSRFLRRNPIGEGEPS
jgi:hypothetical protein